MTDDSDRLQRRLDRERLARKAAEGLLEEKSLALYTANQALQAAADNLERQVEERTRELNAALQEAESANRQLRETQRAQEQQLFAIDQHTIASIADPAGNIVYANDRFVDISGYPRAELIGANHRIVSSGLHPRAMFEGMWQTITAGKVWSGEICNRRKDGSLYWVSATIVPFLDERGLPYQYLSIRTDITPLKLAETSLKQTVFDLNERVKEWTCLNAVTQRLQDEDPGDAELLDAVVELLPPGWLAPGETHARIHYAGHTSLSAGFRESAWQQSAAIPNAGPADRVEIFRQMPDAEDPPFLAEETTLLEGIATQIGQAMERRRTRRELLAARDAAEAASRAKSDFLANMSHEIRTPMNGILGMTDLALEAVDESERSEFLHIVKSSAESLLAILNDILDFSKIEAGKLAIEEVGFDPRRIATECLRLLDLRAREKGIELRSEIADDLPPAVLGDPTRLRQILLNLVGNAIKFTERGTVVLELQAAAPSTGRCAIRFAVQDSGIGIAPDKLDTIFEAFSQADASTTRKFGGTGLGLTITQRLVHLMGGEMGVHSELGRGSTFHFTLPFAPTTIAPEGDQGHPDEQSAAATPAMHVLLVEDNPINQRLAIHLLEKWGHGVTLAHNGQEAVDRIAGGERFDLVLMDMQMPVMGGIEATRCIRRLEAEGHLARHPIVAMTANAMQGDRELCLEAGMDDYLSKPVKQASLAEKLRVFAPASRRDIAAAPPDLPAFDYRQALATMDPEIIDILRPAFLGHYPAEMAALEDGLARNDAEEARRRAHALRGTLAAFGAQPGKRLAAQIEALAAAGDLAAAAQLFAPLQRVMGELVEVLQSPSP